MASGGEMKNMIRMRGSDEKEVVVEEAVAMQSQTLRQMIEDGCAGSIIPIPNITADVLSKIFDYCKKRIDIVACGGQDSEDVKDFDKKFVDVDMNILYNLIMAANYLEVKELLDLICQKVANLIRGKSPQEIRQIFNIKNDLTPEEEEGIIKEHEWAFQ